MCKASAINASTILGFGAHLGVCQACTIKGYLIRTAPSVCVHMLLGCQCSDMEWHLCLQKALQEAHLARLGGRLEDRYRG